MKTYAFGVDIGGTTIKLGLFKTTAALLDTWEIETKTKDNGASILTDIKTAIVQKLKEKNISDTDVAGVGVGVPGPVGEDGTVYRCVNIGWGIFNIEQELTQLTGMKVKAGNDANVAALGEMWQGGGKGCSSIVMVTLGTGVGGGIIINGKIVSGANGAAGEIGHIYTRDGETQTCGCKKKGCLEQYASATGIVRMTREYFLKNPDAVSVLKEKNEFTAKDIFDAAKAGDITANEMADVTAQMLGKAFAQIACVVNPEAFVIGGGMAKAGDMFIRLIQKYYIQYAFHASEKTIFKEAQLGNLAGIYGGVKLVLD